MAPRRADTGASPHSITSLRTTTKDAQLLRIDGKWYDVRGFRHPGGPIALSLGVGRDASVLFHSSHPLSSRSRMKEELCHLELPEAQQAGLNERHAKLVASENETPFVFDGPHRGDAFEREVKAIAKSYFEAEARRRGISLRRAMKATPRRWMEIALLSAAFLVAAAALVSGSWVALAVTPTLTWLWMVNFWHDAAHFAMSSDWRVNAALTYAAPWFSSPLMWYHQHVIGHHCYTNVERRDPDLYHAPTFWRFTKGLPWRPLHVWQTTTTPVLWLLAVWTLLFDKPLAALVTGAFNQAVVIMALPWWRVLLHLLGRVFVVGTLHVWPWYAFPGETIKSLLFSTVPVATFSLWFMAASQVNHHAEELSHAWDARWYRHQVRVANMCGADESTNARQTTICDAPAHPLSDCSGHDVAHGRAAIEPRLLAVWRSQPADRCASCSRGRDD
jgi:hypothetical protein